MCLWLARPSMAVTVADAGRAFHVIALPEQACAPEIEAAAELGKYLGKVTGATFEQVCEREVGGRPAIFVGATEAAAVARISAADLDRDGFMIKVADGNVFVVGHDALATELGVHYLLQRYVGVRWYMPLELGEHVPTQPTLRLPDDLCDAQQPAWKSRLWSSVATMDPMWEKRNLCRSRYSFHHNLLIALKPSVYYDRHPEWYPLIHGQRIAKPTDEAYDWQPCFANRDMAACVAETAIAFFDANPQETSYSLGMNDAGAGGFCQCDACRALDDPAKPTFRGRPNYSNRVFHFMNRVAEIVSQKHPDKLLGCLAYSVCEDVPSFPIHPNIIPYLTNDRAQWRDEAFKRQDQDLLRRWSQAARQLGVYDYYYGAGYVIPRFFPTVSAESIKFCHATGVRAWYAEIYSNWALDGCKAWLASQLLWDVQQDPRALAEQYYRDFFGAAQEPMRRYWERCERIWMEQPGEARWFKGFFDIDQLEMFPPEVCQELRACLDEAAARADTELVRRRVQLCSDGFRWTELYASVYWSDKRMQEAVVTDDAEAQHLRQLLVTYAQAQQDLQRHAREVIDADPLLKPCIPFTVQTRFGQGIVPAIARIADYYELAGKPEPAPYCLAPALAPDNPVARSFAVYMQLRAQPGIAVQRLANPSFEATSQAAAPPPSDWSSSDCPPTWGSWVREGTKAELRWVASPVRSGERAVKLQGAEGAACFLVTVPAKPGDVLLCTVYARAAVEQPDRVSLTVKWHDDQGRWFRDDLNQSVLLPRPQLTEWTPLCLIVTVPEGAGAAVVMLTGSDLKPDDVAYFDDCTVQQLNCPPGASHAADTGTASDPQRH
jgi:hypothetical protein